MSLFSWPILEAKINMSFQYLKWLMFPLNVCAFGKLSVLSLSIAHRVSTRFSSLLFSQASSLETLDNRMQKAGL